MCKQKWQQKESENDHQYFKMYNDERGLGDFNTHKTYSKEEGQMETLKNLTCVDGCQDRDKR